MFRPTGFADLAGRRVGILGYGVEGRAARARLGETCDLVLVDDRDVGEGVLVSQRGGLEALAQCEVVLKSPGIPRRRADVRALEAGGVHVTSALNLWLGETDRSRVVAVTGTKGKSTTTSLVTFFLGALGRRAVAAGNLGRPPYDPTLDIRGCDVVLEVSSFQSVDLTWAPGVVVVTALGSDHLDWHGDEATYHRDKLTITRAAGPHVTLLANTPALRDASSLVGGEPVWVDADETGLAAHLGLIGAHNDRNVALALAATATLTGRESDEVAAAARSAEPPFTPLPGRLSVVAREVSDGGDVRYIDDGLATSALATLAALEALADEAVALIVGGHDRGVDYGELARALGDRPAPTAVVTLGPAGERIATELARIAPDVPVRRALSMDEAVSLARGLLTRGGAVLLSPAAPSFDRYRDWAARSADFSSSVKSLVG